MADKPAILQEAHFVVKEGWLYRFLRGGSIQLNKLMFASAILLIVWLTWAAITDGAACIDTISVAENGTDAGTEPHCSVWFHPTTTFLAGAAIVSFLLSILFGLIGLVVGKQILESTPSQEEVGARREGSPEDQQGADAQGAAQTGSGSGSGSGSSADASADTGPGASATSKPSAARTDDDIEEV